MVFIDPTTSTDTVIIPRHAALSACLETLTREDRWLVYRLERRNGKLTKPPFRADDPRISAKSNNPATWGRYGIAVQACADGKADGIGLALMNREENSRIAALDLDDCRNPENGVLLPWAQRLLDDCRSYAEITPSQRGIRIIGTATGAKLHRKLAVPEGGSVEVYRDAERYIVVTGDTLTPDITELGNIDALCDRIVAEFDKKPSPSPVSSPSPQQPSPGGDDRSLEDLIANGCGTSFGGDRSRATWRVINLMLERGDDRDKIARTLINPANGISTHCLSKAEDPTTYALRQIDKAISERAGVSSAEAEIARLATLPLLKYEKERTTVAKELDIRTSVLDAMVDAKRSGGGDDKQGKAVSFPTAEPWPDPVDGAALLNELDETFKRYIVMSETDRTVSAIWPIHTFVFDRFAVTPRLCVRSAFKDCGKTTYFGVLGHLVQRALRTSSLTPAASFRVIELYRPTMLIDEAGGAFDRAGEMRRILNDGYRFDGAVMRCVGDSFEPRLFKVFAPVAFALIGVLPSDLHSRCLDLGLKRKLANEKVEPYRIGKMGHLDVLGRKIARWAHDNADAIANANPVLPEGLINRRGDLWLVMLSIATVVGNGWVERVHRAIAAENTGDSDDATLLEQLLTDIRTVFAGMEEGEEISSTALTNALIDMDTRPWAELGKSRKPLTAARLARMLHVPGVSVAPRPIQRGKLRGYVAGQFTDIFERYLAIPPLSKCQSVQNPIKTEADDTFQSVISTPRDDTLKSVISPMKIGVADTLTLSQGGYGEEIGSTLPSALAPSRLEALVAWYHSQAKALQGELSPAQIGPHLATQLRTSLAEELVPNAIDAAIRQVAKAVRAKPKAKRRAKP
jgi:putative DNA primase/helicase